MDHLPVPIDGRHVSVPFEAEARIYRPGDFFLVAQEYMADHNLISLDELIHNGFKNNKPRWDSKKLNRLVQSWLFFALLAQVVGKEVDASRFRVDDQNVLSTSGLSSVLIEWADRWKQEAEHSEPENLSKQKNEYVQASMALDYARRFCWKNLAYRPHEEDDYGNQNIPRKLQPPHDKLSFQVVLSIMSIGEILQDELWTRLPPEQKDRVQFWKQPEEEERHWGYSPWCRQSMEKKGWCPSEIRRLEGTMPHVNLIYYSCSIDQGGGTHPSSCTPWECRRSNPAAPLLPLHSHRCKGSNRCDLIGPGKMDFGEDISLEEIISKGKVPLVRWRGREKLQCRGYDLKCNSSVTFGAVSHSYSDKIIECGETPAGQNNRSMLRCQVDSLARDLGNMEDFRGKEPWFWVDVLCFPHDWQMQAKLINCLHTIYEKAAVVLIWDRNLLERDKPGDSKYIETTMRLNLGQWARRLWTLPEAVLAKNLHIGFKDDYLPLTKLEKACDFAKASLNNSDYFIWKAGRPFTSSVNHIRAQLHNHDPGAAQSGSDHVNPVLSAWKALQFREASHSTGQTDQIKVLASILGLDATRYLQKNFGQPPSGQDKHQEELEESEAMMIEFLNHLDETPNLGIPSGLIFLPQPKLPQRRYGWAPKTWMSKQLYTYPLFRPVKKTGYMMPHGLHVEFPGLILHCPQPVIGKKDFWLPVSQTLTKWYKVEIDGAGTSIDRLAEFLDRRDEHCIILNAAKTRDRWEAGLFVKRNGLLANGEVWRVQTVCRVWVRLETRLSKLQDLKKKFYEDAKSQYFGERVDTQRWCIENLLEQYTNPIQGEKTGDSSN